MWKESFFQFVKENPHYLQSMVQIVLELHLGIDLVDPPLVLQAVMALSPIAASTRCMT
jgi:hypothetical protein